MSESRSRKTKVLLATPEPEALLPAFTQDEQLTFVNDHPLEWPDADWAVLWRYRRIISGATIARFQGRIINIHISLLPHNRGADPNLWSWFDGTPKGVTVHQVDEGLDTGPIYSQVLVNLSEAHTLRSSYDCLCGVALSHFAMVWPMIKALQLTPQRQAWVGKSHRPYDRGVLMKLLPQGWDTPVDEVAKIKLYSTDPV